MLYLSYFEAYHFPSGDGARRTPRRAKFPFISVIPFPFVRFSFWRSLEKDAYE
jgi:hypothetical protein